MKRRRSSSLDDAIVRFDNFLRTVSGSVGPTSRSLPESGPVPLLSRTERLRSARLMRVNHCGEVCAQALYSGQALTARTSRVSASMKEAADEETDHLSWCETRLRELDSHTSYLNPFWYAASFVMGAAAGALGDRINLGFVAATEEQVCEHLGDHLERLPESDLRSRAIVEQMREDESKHQQTAIRHGGIIFPHAVRRAMRRVSRLMTGSTYWI